MFSSNLLTVFFFFSFPIWIISINDVYVEQQVITVSHFVLAGSLS